MIFIAVWCLNYVYEDWQPIDWLLLFWVAALIADEFQQIKQDVMGYFDSGWNYLDIAILVLFLGLGLLRINHIFFDFEFFSWSGQGSGSH